MNSVPCYEAFFNKECFFRYTRSKDTAAGVTPGMRDACPRVSGRCAESFCATSFDRPVTDRKSTLSGKRASSSRLLRAISCSWRSMIPGLHFDLLDDFRRDFGRFKSGQSGQVCVTDSGTAQQLQQADILL